MQKRFSDGYDRARARLAPLTSEEAPQDLPALAVLTAALVTCTHPDPSQVGADTAFEGERISWCAACGAVRSDDRSDELWLRSAVASLVTREHVGALAELVHAVRQIHEAVCELPKLERDSDAHITLREIRFVLSSLAQAPLLRDVAGLDRAVARMASNDALPRPGLTNRQV